MQCVATSLSQTEIVYNSNIIAISPEIDPKGNVISWQVKSDNGNVYRANRLIFGAGRDLNIPDVFANISNEKVIHSANFLTSLMHLDMQTKKNIIVIGGAQSSAEIYQNCIEKIPHANVSMMMRSIGLVNYEGSQFTKTLFQNS